MSPALKSRQLKNFAGGTKYYLLSAKGNYEKGVLRYHYDKISSKIRYDMESPVLVDDIITIKYVLVKCHACLMIIGWVLLATNGIIIANFYKGSCPGKTLFGEKIWFQAHRFIQLTAVLLVIAGFIIIFCHVKGYSGLSSLPDSAHPVLGIISTILLIANPIMALFRCHPTDEKRWIFNLSHFLCGISAYVLAIVAIVIGIQLPQSGRNLNKMNAPWILASTFLILVIVIFIIGEVKKWSEEKRNANNLDRKESSTLLPDGVKNDKTQKKNTGSEIIIISLLLSIGTGVVLLVLVLIN